MGDYDSDETRFANYKSQCIRDRRRSIVLSVSTLFHSSVYYYLWLGIGEYIRNFPVQ